MCYMPGWATQAHTLATTAASTVGTWQDGCPRALRVPQHHFMCIHADAQCQVMHWLRIPNPQLPPIQVRSYHGAELLPMLAAVTCRASFSTQCRDALFSRDKSSGCHGRGTGPYQALQPTEAQPPVVAQGAAAALRTRPLPQPTASSLVVEIF
jgi:hypothetical protein